MIKLNNRHLIQLSLAMGVISVSLLMYMVKRIVDGGLYADATGTSGLISVSDIVLTVTALLAIACSIASCFVALRRDSQLASGKSVDKRVNDFTLWCLVFFVLSIFVYWFVLPTVALGVSALVLTYNKKNKKQKNLTIYRGMALFAIVISLVNLAIVFRS